MKIDEIKHLSIHNGLDYFIVKNSSNELKPRVMNQLSSKDKIIGKTILKYRDGRLTCDYEEYIPFSFGKTYKVKDEFDGKVYHYRILSFEDGSYSFISPKNRKFKSLNDALSAFDRCAKLSRSDREYNLL